VKKPWWYVTKTESQAFWLGGLYAAGALAYWVGVVLGDSGLLQLALAVGFTLMAVAYLTSGLARRHLAGRSSEQ
jgi:hypothetical protein